MADIGLNQNITIRNREFHFQTATNIEDGLIRTEVFEQGRLLYSQENKYERRAKPSDEGGEPRIRASLDYFHKNVITDLQTFFDLSKILENQEQSTSHFRLGAIFFSLRIFDKAELHLKTAMELDPEQYNSCIALARCHFYQKKFKESEALLQSLIKKEITYPDLYNLLGMVLFEQSNHIQSMNHFRQAIKINPDYKEAYFNIAATIFKRIYYLKTQQNDSEIQKNLDFLEVILNKIHKIGDSEDRSLIVELKRSFSKKNFSKIHSLIYDYRHRLFHQRIQPEIIGYEFYLWLHHLSDRLGYEKLLYFERKFSKNLEQYTDYADIWNYLALIHLLLCRDYFLQGLNNFKESTKINPKFTKAKNNLRLVQNDGREFLSLIKAIIS
jgi:tetratricopeptide (TPR) repeat protein